jgi:hypothetical protein
MAVVGSRLPPAVVPGCGASVSTEISFSKTTYRNEFQITVKVAGALGLDEMNYTDSHAHSRATVDAHSLGRTLLVALLVSLGPLVAMLAVTSGVLTVAFLGGVATAGVLAFVRRSVRSRRDRRGHETRAGVATAR